MKKSSSSIGNVVILLAVSLVLCSCTPTSAVKTVTETPKPVYSAPVQDETSSAEAKYNALLGAAAVANEDWDTAVGFLETSVKKAPAHEKAQYQEMLGMAYAGRGTERVNNGRLSSGISDLEHSLTLLKDREILIQCRDRLGLAYGKRGITNAEENSFSRSSIDSGIMDLETGIRYVQNPEMKTKFSQALALFYAVRAEEKRVSGDQIGALQDVLAGLKSLQ
ncbi:MAG: hypothetical protein AB7S75_10700 [Desulfococcaceae bacterium]